MIAFTTPFSVKTGAVGTTTNYDRIVRDQVIDAVATNPGERLMNPTWGCNVRSRVFDPSDFLARSDLTNTMKQSLTNFVPRALINSVDLSLAEGEPNVVDIGIGYQASAYSPEANLSVPVTTGSPTS